MTAFDLFDPLLRSNPYPVYRHHLTHDPIHYIPGPDSSSVGVCLLFKNADVVQWLKDKRLGREWWRFVAATKDEFMAQPHAFAPYPGMVNNWMSLRDPPDHTRLRGLSSGFLAPRVVTEMESHIQEAADALLDRAQEAGEMEVIGQYLFPLAATIFAQMMGLRDDNLGKFRGWAMTIAAALDVAPTTEVLNAASRCSAELQSYFGAAFAEKRREPADDVISKMVAAVDEGLLSQQEAVDNCVLFMLAGFETTVSLLSTGLHRLLRHPEQFEMLRQDPELIQTTLDEFLRYDPPLQVVDRLAFSDIEIGGKTIRRGDRILFVLGAANRDAEIYAEPDRFDITRQGNRHLGFGMGIHSCIGARLAYAEGRIAINTLLRRTRQLKLKSDDLKWRNNWIFRQMEALPIRFSARS